MLTLSSATFCARPGENWCNSFCIGISRLRLGSWILFWPWRMCVRISRAYRYKVYDHQPVTWDGILPCTFNNLVNYSRLPLLLGCYRCLGAYFIQFWGKVWQINFIVLIYVSIRVEKFNLLFPFPLVAEWDSIHTLPTCVLCVYVISMSVMILGLQSMWLFYQAMSVIFNFKLRLYSVSALCEFSDIHVSLTSEWQS